MDIAEHCIAVIDKFKQLQATLATVNGLISEQDHDLPAWFSPPNKLPLPTNSTMRQQAGIFLNQLEYLDAQQPREILVGAGIFAASAATIIALESLNSAKQEFKQAVLKLKAAKISTGHALLNEGFNALLAQRPENLAHNLHRLGLARLHLKQCYRIVPIFKQRPIKIAWTWANTRSIIKITVAEAYEMLSKQQRDPGIERQIKLLQGLALDEKLAIIQDLAPHLRANLVLPDGYTTKRVMVKGPIPIFYLNDHNNTLPEFTPPGVKRGRDKERVIRKDVKINPEPFLPAIRAHRYLELV